MGPHGKQVRACTFDLLIAAGRREGASELEQRIATFFTLNPCSQRAIAHGQGIYLLSALALAESTAEGGDAPGDGMIAFLMLAANDYEPNRLESTRREKPPDALVADVTYHHLFNRSRDPLRELARTAMLVDLPPARGPLADAALWSRVQDRAFGTSFAEYAQRFLAPLYLFSRTWRGQQVPVFPRHLWFPVTSVPEALRERWTSGVTMSLDEAIAAAKSERQANGLPRVPALFFRKPFLAISNDQLLVLSPATALDQLSLAPWGALNGAVKAEGLPSEVWSRAFGDVFERWCRSLADEARATDGFRDEVLLSPQPGDENEIEDVVFVRHRLVVLGSVKGFTFPEKSLKAARRREDVLGFLERVFFARRDRSRGYRGGALRLLETKIGRIRQGDYETRGVRRDSVILPLVVAFDEVGEGPALYRWLDARCKRDALISYRHDVLPVSIAGPDEFRILVALGARRGSVCELLAQKVTGADREETLQAFLLRRESAIGELRMPSHVRRFEAMCAPLEALAQTPQRSGPRENA